MIKAEEAKTVFLENLNMGPEVDTCIKSAMQVNNEVRFSFDGELTERRCAMYVEEHAGLYSMNGYEVFIDNDRVKLVW